MNFVLDTDVLLLLRDHEPIWAKSPELMKGSIFFSWIRSSCYYTVVQRVSIGGNVMCEPVTTRFS